MRNMHRAAVVVVLAILFPGMAFAQYGLRGVENTVSIVISPESPEPGNSVHLSLQSPVLDLKLGSIVWLVDGKIIASGDGATAIDVVAPRLGEKMSIEAQVASMDVDAVAKAVIQPTEVDLLYDSGSLVPPFYRGRALPSSGSVLKLQAIVRFKRENGTFVPEKDIIYNWKRNSIDVPELSGKGKSMGVVSSSQLYDAATFAVDAVSTDKQFEGSAKVTIPPVKPLLLLYEDNPLYGMMWHQVIASQAKARDTEMTIAAMPYFSNARGPNDSQLEYEWTVNDTRVQSTTTASELALGAKGGGTARIELIVNHLQNLFFTASGAWTILFSNLPPSSKTSTGFLPLQ